MDTTAEKLTTEPLVSILMLTYNRAELIGTAINSVIAQTYRNWELIIVDDGSTDSTHQILESYTDPRIRYIRHTDNQGVINRRNESVRESNGEYLAVLDSDDKWIAPNKLAHQVEFLMAHPEYVLVGTQAELHSGTTISVTSYPSTDGAIRRSLLSKNVFINSSCMFKKNALSNPPYRIHDYLVEDYSMWLRVGLQGKMTNLKDVTVALSGKPEGTNATKYYTCYEA